MREIGEHSYHRRAKDHDYYGPFIYNIVLKKRPGREDFGSVRGEARIPLGQLGCAEILESKLGRIIAKAIAHLPYEFPIIKLHQFCVMPDHVHLLMQILFRSEKHLDFYMDRLVDRIASKYSLMMGEKIVAEDIFEKGYCDKPLFEDRSLDGLYFYIKQNPHRLAMRIQYPQFFRRARNLKIGEKVYEGYGNLFQLGNPDKIVVKISRKFTVQERIKSKETVLEAARTGSVLVSPFIHPYEKEIRSEAESSGARIILITHEAFGDRYKPAAHDFGLCEEGRLLIISLGLPAKTPLTRKICEEMNELARIIAQSS